MLVESRSPDRLFVLPSSGILKRFDLCATISISWRDTFSRRYDTHRAKKLGLKRAYEKYNGLLRNDFRRVLPPTFYSFSEVASEAFPTEFIGDSPCVGDLCKVVNALNTESTFEAEDTKTPKSIPFEDAFCFNNCGD
ncbi:hypothetical protein [Dyadobacter soli]|uniref:hypothetical protein n=1 Tax=Dyadobacter soli TaxID=659014 RepID=UPI00115FF272|nr:hypothetical protein [Dyadobacter soli]